MPKISIIIPIYNGEKYLSRCIDSVLNQTFMDFELLLIDDGSTDGSLSICNEYAKTDSRIRIIHKENGGVSDTRNCGLNIAAGEYISFIDCDDFIDKSMIEYLYCRIIKDSSELSTCSIMNCYKSRNVPQCAVTETIVVNAEEAYRLLLEGVKITGSPCGKLYKAKVFENLRFVKNHIYEDAILFTELFTKIKRVSVSTEPLYYYYHRENSYTTSFRTVDTDAIYAYELNLKAVQKHFPKLIEQAYFRLYWAYFITLDKMYLRKDYKTIPNYKTVLSYLKKNAFKIMKNKYFSKSRRFSAFLLLINSRLYKYISNKNSKINFAINE